MCPELLRNPSQSWGDSQFTVHVHPDQNSQLSILGRGEDSQFTVHTHHDQDSQLSILGGGVHEL